MSQILFIATDAFILALIENLQQAIETKICHESDYTAGIKKIFDTRPSIVFLQHKIGDVACDKLANQVNMLLEGEAIPLVLLSDETASSYNVVSTYEACIDLCLPLDELSSQVQQLLHTLPEICWKRPAQSSDEEPFEAGSDATMELNLSAGSCDFSLMSPWDEDAAVSAGAASPPAEVGTLEALEGNAVPVAGQVQDPIADEPQFLADFLQDRFVIEPLPAAFEGKQQKSLQDFHRIEKENPNSLFGSMSEPSLPASKPRPKSQDTAGRAVPPAPPRGAPASPKKANPSAPAALLQQPDAPTPKPPKQQEARFAPADELSASAAASLGIKERGPRYFRGVVIGLLLVFCVAALDLVFTLHSGGSNAGSLPEIGRLDARMIAPPSASTASLHLPQFIPQVPPDAGYPASHPGWERYYSDALEYLVYREKGEVRAVQVLSDQRGAISLPFLKTCIRLSTGSEQFVTKNNEEKSGMQLTTGTLKNGGEIVVYRVASSGEIRGFVLSFPSGPQTAAGAKK